MKKKFDVGNRSIFILVGYRWNRFGLGFCISKWGIDIDLSVVWLTIEWWRNDSEI
jgi:hypothetical protein